jgi:hypothetical protein
VITDPSERARLLSHLLRQLRERLAPRLKVLFDELEARLFDLAERSRVATQQHVYFDGLRECRRKRNDVEQDFLEALQATLRAPRAGAVAAGTPPLSLVEHAELEETLALSALADRTAARQAVAIDALDRRIAMLQNVQRVPGETPRLSPQAFGQAFRQACQRLDVGIEIRLVAFSLFGRHVLDALEAIYAEFNRELIAAGVLPALPQGAGRGVAPRAGRMPPPAPRTATGEDAPRESSRVPPPPTDSASTDEAIHTLLTQVRDLIAAHKSASSSVDPAARDSRPPAAPLSVRQLLDALDRVPPMADEPRRIKSELLAASRLAGLPPESRLSARDEDTVDMIGLVFDAVRRDANLAGPMQPLIAKLQVPFLKAALSDPALMQGSDHPAQRLVDELGEVALGWTASVDPEGQLLGRIAQIVDSLLQPASELGRERFEHAIAELNAHLDAGRRRAELAEQRAVEAALGRERLRIARSRVGAMLERRLSRHAPLPWIRQLLRGPWASYLVLLWLRQGESGESFRQGFSFVDELIWCDEQGQTTQDVARLRANLEELEEDLRFGLSTVAYHDREIERLAGELRQFIGSLLQRKPPPAFLYEIDPKLGGADFSQSWSEQDLEDQPDIDQVDAQMLARLRAVEPGTWFEFGARSGERGKLSWTSPFSGRCLFVNRNGLRVDEVAPERLARDIEQGITRILERTRLLQRSLQSLLDQLRAARASESHSA